MKYKYANREHSFKTYTPAAPRAPRDRSPLPRRRPPANLAHQETIHSTKVKPPAPLASPVFSVWVEIKEHNAQRDRTPLLRRHPSASLAHQEAIHSTKARPPAPLANPVFSAWVKIKDYNAPTSPGPMRIAPSSPIASVYQEPSTVSQTKAVNSAQKDHTHRKTTLHNASCAQKGHIHSQKVHCSAMRARWVFTVPLPPKEYNAPLSPYQT
jgi:hypothetical protein